VLARARWSRCARIRRWVDAISSDDGAPSRWTTGGRVRVSSWAPKSQRATVAAPVISDVSLTVGQARIVAVRRLRTGQQEHDALDGGWDISTQAEAESAWTDSGSTGCPPPGWRPPAAGSARPAGQGSFRATDVRGETGDGRGTHPPRRDSRPRGQRLYAVFPDSSFHAGRRACYLAAENASC